MNVYNKIQSENYNCLYKKGGLRMKIKKIIVAVIIMAILLYSCKSCVCAAYYYYWLGNPYKIRCTVYCDHGVTKSGEIVRDGIAAMNDEMLGKTAVIYRYNSDGSIGELIGIYDILDTGSNKYLKAGKRIDIYCEDLELCNAWIKEYGDYVYIQIIDAVG